MCFFNLDISPYLSPSQQSFDHRRSHVTEIAVADTGEAYSNTQDEQRYRSVNYFYKKPYSRHLISPRFYLWKMKKIFVIR